MGGHGPLPPTLSAGPEDESVILNVDLVNMQHSLWTYLWHLCYRCLWQQDMSRIYVVFLWIMIRQIFWGRYTISIFDDNRPTWIQAVIVEKIFLKKNLDIGRHPYSCCHKKHHFGIFVKVALFKHLEQKYFLSY